MRQEVYDEVLSELIRGDLSPGQRIRDDELAQRLNVSRTPVREALTRLCAAGLVDTSPNRYTRVTPIFSDDFENLLDALVELYALAIVRVVDALTPQDDAEIEAFARRVSAAAPSQSLVAIHALGSFCAERMRSPILAQAIDVAQPQLLRALHFDPQMLFEASALQAVGEVLQAFRVRDADAANAALRRAFASLRSEVERVRLSTGHSAEGA